MGGIDRVDSMEVTKFTYQENNDYELYPRGWGDCVDGNFKHPMPYRMRPWGFSRRVRRETTEQIYDDFDLVISNYALGKPTDGIWFGTFCIEKISPSRQR